MTLALIIGMWAVLGSAASGAIVVQVPAGQAPVATQETQPQQDPQPDAPQAAAPQEPAQPEEQGKTDSPSPQTTAPPTPAPQTESSQPEPAAKETESKATSSTTAKSTSAKSTTAKSKKSSPRHKAAPQPGADPAKVVVRNGSTADPAVQISPRLSKQQASHQLKNTDQLLTTTDANLKKISGRVLNPSQQDTVTQVRKYMEQAKAAVDAGDLDRAHNLAVKAQLLSSELIKQQ